MKSMREKSKTILGLIMPAVLFFSACSDSSPKSLVTQSSTPQLGTHHTSPQTISLPPRSVRFERLSSADGLSFPFVQDVTQDHLGFMWFAISSGLNKCHGHSFTVYKHRPGDPASLAFDDLEVVFEDSDGNIWVGGAGGIDRFDRQTATFTRIDERGQAFCIAEDQDGTLWAGFWHGLYGYDRDTLEMIYTYPRSAGATDDPNALADG